MDQLLPKALFLHKQDPAHGGNVGHADTEMTEHYFHVLQHRHPAGLIHELRLMQCYLMPDETALRELSEQVIEKLKLLTDAEFAELEFPLD